MKKSLLLSFIFVFALVVQVLAQNRTVTGKVTDQETGQGLPGVTILLKGTSTGTATGVDGNFSISVPATGGTLVFSYIGFDAKEVAITNVSTINVQLGASSTEISEVVIVGYVEQDVKKITGSVATVSSAKIEQVPIATFDQILQGRAPGLQVSAGSGQPGSSSRVC